jgi:hypothetical protein
MIKIIFLDIDGVLNLCYPKHDKFGRIFHPHFVDNLKMIIDETDAKIVISSTWRADGIERLRELWKYRNYPGEIIDITPFSKSRIRGKEINFMVK